MVALSKMSAATSFMTLALLVAIPAIGIPVGPASAAPIWVKAPLLDVSDSTQWLQDRREKDRKRRDAARREREKRDPLVPLYAPRTTSPPVTSRPTLRAPTGTLRSRPPGRLRTAPALP